MSSLFFKNGGNTPDQQSSASPGGQSSFTARPFSGEQGAAGAKSPFGGQSAPAGKSLFGGQNAPGGASSFASQATQSGQSGQGGQSSFGPRPPFGGEAGAAKPLTGLDKSGLSSVSVRVTDEEFVQLRDFIYQQSGIFIAENRKYLIENRLTNRIKDLNLKNFSEYYYYLRFDANRKAELTRLFEAITTNETSFYRNPPQLEVFQNVILKRVIEAERKKGQRKLRIWSAGCSTGEEPYTLAIMIHEVLKSEIASWDIRITANDLSEAVLASARKGVYTEYALRTTPKDIIDRYFVKEGVQFAIKPELKKIISFGSINLSDRAQAKRLERSQIVFCRNVIIYFDDEMKRQVIESFYDNLLPGGYLFIGHSESLHNISRSFIPEHHAGAIVYCKQA